MASAVSDKRQLVEEIVLALTGTSATGSQPASLVDQMSRAAQEVDDRTASAFCKALLDSLCEEPGNVRLLEALMILGLAHPEVLKNRGISLAVEGRRLAILLDQRGEGERARCLLDLITARLPEEPPAPAAGDLANPEEESDEAVSEETAESVAEEYIKRARSCVKAGRIPEAITWLQEVLLVDRSRRDVARMIRDLRCQDSEGRSRRKTLARNSIIFLVLAGGVTYFGLRELRLREQFHAIPAALASEPPALQARLAALEGMITDHRLWAGRLEVERECKSVQLALDRLAAAEIAAARERELQLIRNLELAEGARLRGLMHVELSDYPTALEDFRESLLLAGADWEHRERVERDVLALEAWQKGQK